VFGVYIVVDVTGISCICNKSTIYTADSKPAKEPELVPIFPVNVETAVFYCRSCV
jgi:hypothetical protein